MRLVAELVVLVVGLAISGCEVSETGGGKGEASSGCRAVSYDLTQPPTRVDLGMEPGASVLDVSCDEGFQVTLALPDDAKVSLTARRVNADSRSAANPETGPPTTVDVHSVALDVDEAVRVGQSLADDLGINAQPLESWRAQVQSGTSTGSVDSPFLQARLGYLTAEMQVQHLGTSGNNHVHLIFTWS